MTSELRIVSGPPWTLDGRWVVVGPLCAGGPESIVFDPCNGMVGDKDTTMAWMDLLDCLEFVAEAERD